MCLIEVTIVITIIKMIKPIEINSDRARTDHHSGTPITIALTRNDHPP